jgi:hypothetical protein
VCSIVRVKTELYLPNFKLIVFEQARASRCGMETRVLVLRVLRDRSTSLVVQVLHSNAVLKCEVGQE